MILDVGCGSRPKGEVNLDLHFDKSEHHRLNYNAVKIQNFIIGSAESIPFKTRSFDSVYCSHTIEHLQEPLQAIKEFNRVSRNLVICIVPNNPVYLEHQTHLYSWSLSSFENFLKLVFPDVNVRPQTRVQELLGSRIIKFLLRGNPRLNISSTVMKPFERLFGRILAVELYAICRKKPLFSTKPTHASAEKLEHPETLRGRHETDIHNIPEVPPSLPY